MFELKARFQLFNYLFIFLISEENFIQRHKNESPKYMGSIHKLQASMKS